LVVSYSVADRRRSSGLFLVDLLHHPRHRRQCSTRTRTSHVAHAIQSGKVSFGTYTGLQCGLEEGGAARREHIWLYHRHGQDLYNNSPGGDVLLTGVCASKEAREVCCFSATWLPETATRGADSLRGHRLPRLVLLCRYRASATARME